MQKGGGNRFFDYGIEGVGNVGGRKAADCGCCLDSDADDAGDSYAGDQSGCGEAGDDAGDTDVVTADYRFLYLGPRGTWTPLHTDVLKSFSWSVNVAGWKR